MMPLVQLFVAAFGFSETDSRAATHIPVNVNDIVVRAKSGDGGAVATLYQIFAQPIYRYVSYRVSSAEDAEDIVSEVFTRMVERLPLFVVTEAPFEAWLYRIAAARVAEFYRRSHRRKETELEDHLADEGDLPEEELLNKQNFELLREAVRKLSEEQQMILFLRFVERKSHEDVAAILNKSVTAVKSAQYRALAQLTELLGSNHKTRHYLRGQHE